MYVHSTSSWERIIRFVLPLLLLSGGAKGACINLRWLSAQKSRAADLTSPIQIPSLSSWVVNILAERRQKQHQAAQLI